MFVLVVLLLQQCPACLVRLTCIVFVMGGKCLYSAGRPAFARPCVRVHKSTSLMSSSLLLKQCPACLVRLTKGIMQIRINFISFNISTLFFSWFTLLKLGCILSTCISYIPSNMVILLIFKSIYLTLTSLNTLGQSGPGNNFNNWLTPYFIELQNWTLNYWMLLVNFKLCILLFKLINFVVWLWKATIGLAFIKVLLFLQKTKNGDKVLRKFTSAPSLQQPQPQHTRLEHLPGSPVHDEDLNPNKPLPPMPPQAKKYIKWSP